MRGVGGRERVRKRKREGGRIERKRGRERESARVREQSVGETGRGRERESARAICYCHVLSSHNRKDSRNDLKTANHKLRTKTTN